MVSSQACSLAVLQSYSLTVLQSYSLTVLHAELVSMRQTKFLQSILTITRLVIVLDFHAEVVLEFTEIGHLELGETDLAHEIVDGLVPHTRRLLETVQRALELAHMVRGLVSTNSSVCFM